MPLSTTVLPDPTARPRATLIVGGVLAAVGVSAGFYGGVVAWWQPLLIALAGLLAIVALLGPANGRALWPLVALTLFVGLAAGQLAPLPWSVVGLLSPTRAASLAELLDPTPPAATLSYYEPETRVGLAHALVGLAVFAAVASGLRSTAAIKALLGGLFLIGVAEACLALAQVATDAPGVYWQEGFGYGAWTGSFVNHSNFSQLLNLSIGAGLGLLLIRSSEDRRSRRPGGERGLGAYFQRHGAVLLGIGVQVVAIAASLSRGGVLGALVGGGLVAIALGREKSLGPRAWALLLVPLVAFVGLVLVGFDTVYERLGTLSDQDAYADRWELTKATIRVGLDHPLFGTGLNTHRYVFPAYDTTGALALAEQADNDWAQLFEEMGLVGVGLVLAFLAAVAWAGWRVVARGRGAARYAVYGALYGLAACVVQSFSDFGQRLPAVFCATAALSGVVLAAAAVDRQRVEPRRPLGAGRFLMIAATVAIGGTMGWWAWLDYRAERWWSVAYAQEQLLRDDAWEAPPEAYIDLLAAAEGASAARPADVEYAYWLNAYRWQAVTVGVDPAPLIQTDEGRGIAERLVTELRAVRRLCPTYGPTHTLEGQLLMLLGDPEAKAAVERGVALAPNDPAACFAAASAACLGESPNRERAAEMLERCVALSGGYYADAATLWIEVFGDLELPERLADGDIGRLRQLADLLEGRLPFEADRDRFRRDADRLTAERVASGEANAGQLAAMASRKARDGETEAAVRFYRQALASNHANLAWRIALCDLLESLERYDEAYREARLCFRLRPGWGPAKERLERLSLLIPPEEPESRRNK